MPAKIELNVQASQIVPVVKNTPAGDIRDMDEVPGSGRSPGGGHDNPFKCSCLENPHGQRSLWATVHGVAKSQTQPNNLACMHILMQ